MEQIVLIIADDSGHASALAARWRQQPGAPEFVMVHGARNADAAHLLQGSCHLAITLGVPPAAISAMLARLDAVGIPVLCSINARERHAANGNGGARSSAAASLQRLQAEIPGLIVLPENGDPDDQSTTLVMFGREVLRRLEAVARARKVEAQNSNNAAQMALGKYVAESMHGFNNALTAVLGNAELLLLDMETFSPEMQEQVDAIHSNALRLHEMMQRFSSMESEMHVTRKDSRPEAAKAAQAYLSGT